MGRSTWGYADRSPPKDAIWDLAQGWGVGNSHLSSPNVLMCQPQQYPLMELLGAGNSRPALSSHLMSQYGVCVFRKHLSNHCRTSLTDLVQVLCLVFSACSGQSLAWALKIERPTGPVTILKACVTEEGFKVSGPLFPSPQIDQGLSSINEVESNYQNQYQQ